MRLGIYSVLDKAVGAYLRPFYTRSKMEAIRSFSDAVADEKSDFGKHAEDFVMMYHGEFDDNSGVFYPVDPQRVISAIECFPAGVTQAAVDSSGDLKRVK
ncbi:DNA binding protein VP5 [Gokushovirinae Fen672_31]|uniref:DNA binding protein VP5 n=1 Tax=Gokushovirinae Fen672_31 TaxID=1655656 RepID=UPI00063D5A25|nr:DNA binding protein VP5 [Gokushovirinae Fen672_31]AKI26924.1 DNA binding protein VP5 [Gokushovirinae Fen672_31]